MNKSTMDKATWAAALETYIAERRKAVPIPPRDSLTEEEEAHCQYIGGEFIGWHNRGLRPILMQRQALRIMEFEPEPLIVFTTSMAGLVAAQEIFPEPQGEVVCLLHEEFNEWEQEHPAPQFKWHIHHWSYFQALDEKLARRARTDYPDVDVSEFRVHVTGDLWGEQCGTEERHLWQWNGDEMELLEEGFSQVVF